MASQWPQQYPAPEGYGYNQYPQQYSQQPPQQYAQQPPQPYAPQPEQHAPRPHQYAQQPQQYAQQPQQYAQQQPQYYPPAHAQTPTYQYPQQPPHQPPQQQFPQQGGQYTTQYPSTASPAYAPPDQPQPTHHGCYNCGDPGHWAMACPESKREVPAGAYNRPPPFKRQKPNPPVVTKYAVPPHVQQNQGHPPQNYGAQYSGPGYPQYQGPQESLTPMPGQPTPQQQWQQHTYPQHYQQTYPQQQQYAQPYQHAGYQHQQHYMQQAAPTPATPHTAQYPHQGSPQAAQANTASYFQNGQYAQQPISQAPSVNYASPGATASQITAYQQQQYPTSTAASAQPTTHVSPKPNVSQTAPIQAQHPASNSLETTQSQQGSRNSSVSMQSMSVTDKQPSVEPREGDDEEGEEDLNKLDVPDIPAVIDGSFASLVDRPLPANFIVADALEPFDPPKPENDGRCQSKFVILDSSSTFHLRIKDTKHWEDMKNDPLFRTLRASNRVTPLDKIMSIYRPPKVPDGREQVELEEGEWTQNTGVHRDQGRDVMDRLERSLSAGHATESPTTVPRTASWDRGPLKKSSTHIKPDRSPEDVVKPRGADGPCKPYKNNNHVLWPLPPPPAREESPAPSSERTPPMRSRTPSMYELNELHQQEYGIRPGGSTFDGTTPAANGSGTRPSETLDPFEPPPPPPHLGKPASFDGVSEDLNGHHPNGNGTANFSNGRSSSMDHSGSPSTLRHDSATGRKKYADDQALSEEDNTPKRRQADDTKSKLKKRQQAKVAAAYR
ncbi:MAG: hypothetical protein Q9207_001668 [Kuettlingeria erythrocarpa]